MTLASYTRVNVAQGNTAVELDRWVTGGWEGHSWGLTANHFTMQADLGYLVRLTHPKCGRITVPHAGRVSRTPGTNSHFTARDTKSCHDQFHQRHRARTPAPRGSP